MSTDLVPIRRALISVSDKSGLEAMVSMLISRGVEIVSTGGTAEAIRKAGFAVTDVSDVTGFPEMMDGRVKTLHPKIHGGLLGLRDDPSHVAAMQAHGIESIDLLVVSLYPFEKTVAAGADYDTCVENIDIGGPAMIRAAAKNHKFVTVLVDQQDYARLGDAMRANDGATGIAFRRELAQIAYGRCAAYDAAVSTWMADAIDIKHPRRWVIAANAAQSLRYGENPHQSAAFYKTGSERSGVANARQIQGKALSYNNINDTDAAFELVAEFDAASGPACAIIKHANPCGVATADTLLGAYQAALACDPVSAFGGVIALNRRLDQQTAEIISGIFTEVIIAPAADAGAMSILAKKKNLRLLLTGGLPDPGAAALVTRQVSGGLLIQDKDVGHLDPETLNVVTARAPDAREITDMLFAWKVAKHVKSNAIVYAKNSATVGIGAGQMSRVDSARIAAFKARDATKETAHGIVPTAGAVVASDAFFPFADGIQAAIDAGACAIIQPGGSIRDNDVIAAADAAGLAMVFTGMRHFRH